MKSLMPFMGMPSLKQEMERPFDRFAEFKLDEFHAQPARRSGNDAADDFKGGCHAVDDCCDSSGAVGARHGQFVHGRRVSPSTAGDRRHCHRVPVHWRPPIHLTAPR